MKRVTLWTALAAALLFAGLATPPHPRGIPHAQPRTPHDASDLLLFRAVADRLAAGAPYYVTMARELTTRGYPTGSVANWRMPLYLELLGHAPHVLRAVLLVVGVLVLAGTAWTCRTGPWLLAVVLQLGVVVTLWRGALVVMPEPLTGGLIALSVFAGLTAWRGTSVALGTMALYIRELALPYVLIRMAYALWMRHWREAISWTLGVAGYGCYLAWHVIQVHQAMPLNPTWHPLPWIQFGGLRFVLATVRANAILTALPWWITPFALSALVYGAWRSPTIVKLTVLGYLGMFAVVGHPFNWYWGWIPGMLFPLAWAGAYTQWQTSRSAASEADASAS